MAATIRCALASLAALLLASCVQQAGFVCQTNAACSSGGTSGFCEASGACSFADGTCASGRRYGSAVNPALANQCVGGGVDVDAGVLPVDGGPLPPNLLPNPSFEVDLSAWDTFNATLARVPGGHAGSFAALVCNDTGSDYTIDDLDKTVLNAPLGATYLAAAWVRVPVGEPLQTITLTVRERGGGTLATQTSVAADGTFRELRAMHTTSMSGADVDVFVGVAGGAVGDCFEIDDVTLGRL